MYGNLIKMLNHLVPLKVHKFSEVDVIKLFLEEIWKIEISL